MANSEEKKRLVQEYIRSLRSLKKTYPEVTQEFNALLAADGKTWQSAASPRWRQTHAP